MRDKIFHKIRQLCAEVLRLRCCGLRMLVDLFQILQVGSKIVMIKRDSSKNNYYKPQEPEKTSMPLP